MIRKKSLQSLVLLFTVGVLTACSSYGELSVSRPPTAPIDHTATVAVTVRPDLPIEDTEQVHREVADRVRAELFGRLVSDRVFKRVVHEADPADYAMDVRVLDAREVSTGLRIMFGVMAGDNNLTLDVTVRDRATRREVTAFQVEGHSASHPFSSEAALEDAIREAVEKVVIALR